MQISFEELKMLSSFILCFRSAFISITLSNEGRNAYQPDVWGKTIVVERRFEKSKNSSNNAGYRILGENGLNITVLVL